MRLTGERVKRTRLIQAGEYVVAVEVELVIPVDDPSEPCYESETIQFLREVRERARHGHLNWLRRHGKVYQAIDAGRRSFDSYMKRKGARAQSELDADLSFQSLRLRDFASSR